MAQVWEIFIYVLVSVTFFLLLYIGIQYLRVPVKQPSLSLLLLVRDMEESIEGLVRQIHGFRQRTSISIDVVVVVDGSQDQTREILSRLSLSYPLTVANSDSCQTLLDTGIMHCRGQLICIIDMVTRLRSKEAADALESFFGLAKCSCRVRQQRGI